MNKIYDGTGIIDPSILKDKIKNGENLVIIDSSEVYLKKYYDELKDNGYDIHILNLKDTTRSNSWNFLEYPYSLYKSGNMDKVADILDTVTRTITFESGNTDTFWFLTSAGLIQGIILSLFNDANPNQINFKSIWALLEASNENYKNEDKLSVYFKSKNTNDLAYINASATVNAPRDTKTSIISVAKSRIKDIITRKNLNDIISGNEIKIEDFAKEKVALFIIMPEFKEVYSLFAPIILNEIDIYLSNRTLPKCNIIISNLNSIEYIYNLDRFLQRKESNHIEYHINIVSKETFKEKYNPILLESIDLEKTVEVELDPTPFKNYPVSKNAEIEAFDIDKYFEANNIKNDVVMNVDDIIKEIDKKISELEKNA